MASRFAVSIVAALLVVALFLPAGLAAATPQTDGSTTAADGDGVGLVVDGFYASLPTPIPAQSGERLGSQQSKRIERDRNGDGVLEQPTRAAIYRAIDESPGATLSDIADTVGVTRSTVRYHADILLEAGLVDATETSGALRYATADEDVELAAALDAEGTGAVLRAVAEREPASVTAIAEATDRAPSTVSHHLSRLEARGLVDRERVGEAVTTSLSLTARTALDTAAPVSADD